MSERPVDLDQARILLVDDQPTNLKVLRLALEPAGYHILAATSGERALELAQRARPDLILLDVMMPGMDGFETCRRLKADAATESIPVLFTTALTETENVVEGFGVGGADYIAKPIRNEELMARVQTHLERTFFERALVERNDELAHKNEQLQREIDQRRVLTGQKQQLTDQLSMIWQREAEGWGIPGVVGKSPLVTSQ